MTTSIIKDIIEAGPPKHLLKFSENLFHRPINLDRDVWWVMDMSFRFAHVSEAVYHMRGLSATYVCGQKPSDYLSTPSLCKLIKIWSDEIKLETCARDTDIRVLQLDQLHVNGNLIPTEIAGSWIRGPDNMLIGAVGITRAIDTNRSCNIDSFATWADSQGLVPCLKVRNDFVPTDETIGKLIERFQHEAEKP
jgi:PAS domain S-box-containing protein